MFLTRLFVGRPTLVTVLLALVLLAGTISALTLVQQQFPLVDIPTVNVSVSYSGASPSEMQDAIVRPIEDQISGAPYLDHITTTIESGRASITASFQLGSDKNADLIEVQRRVNNAGSQLPTDLVTPSVSTFDPSQSTVVSLVVTSPQLSPADLSRLVNDRIVPAIQQVPGVSNVQANGVLTPALLVDVDPNLLSSNNLTVTDVISAIQGNNVRAPGGIAYGTSRETTLDVRGDITGPQSVATLPLTPSGTAASSSSTTSGLDPWSFSNRVFHVGDVANVTSGAEVQRVYAFFNGTPSISLQVTKATGASEVTASNNVIKALPDLEKQFPQVHFQVANVQSDYTQQQLNGVIRTLLEGVVLTALAMLFFLRSWRNAIVVLIAIPTSLAITLSAMRLANFTIDTVSLLAMTLVIGILVDDSIVVLENVERHHAAGEPAAQAAIRGRSEIGLAAIVITMVDVVVFLPIAFLPGTVGLFLKEFGLVVVVATLTSLFVSFTVTPALAGRWSLNSHWRAWPVIDWFTDRFESLRHWYAERALPWGLRHPLIVVAVCALSFVGAVALVPLGVVGFEFIPNVDRGQIAVQVTYPAGTPLTTTTQTIRKMQDVVDTIPDLKNSVALGGAYNAPFGGFVNEGNVGQIQVNLLDNRKKSTDFWVSWLRQRVSGLAHGARVTVIPSTSTGGGVSQPIDYVVTAANGAADPTATAQQVVQILRQTPGTANVTSSALDLSPQINVTFDRAAAQALNVSIGTASQAVRAAFGGAIATQFTSPTGIEQVQVIYPRQYQTSLQQILQIPIRSNTGQVVHVGDIVKLQYAPQPPLLTRQNRQTVVHVSANVAAGSVLSNVQRDFRARLAQQTWPSGVTVTPAAGGNQQNLRDTTVGMAAALTLAFVLVYLLMLALYNSYISPFIIMFAVPVAAVGALGALAITHQTLNLFSLIGTVLLIGLVTKNGILLVDFANRAREDGMNKVAAIREAARVRFRPIVMTTISMIAGMAPLALALEPGSETRQGLGIVVIGGLASSLVLTLLLVPIIYVALAPKKVVRSHTLEPDVPTASQAPRELHGVSFPS